MEKIMKFLKWINQLFQNNVYHQNLENYVTSKNPTTPAEVDYWVRRYDEKQKGWAL